MNYLIIGGSASGKSKFAEDLAVALKPPYFYIATMQPFGAETLKRIDKHREQRKQKNFETIECYNKLSQLKIPKKGTILLECMSNLVANEMFSESGSKEDTIEEIINGIENIINQSENVVIVSNDVFSDGKEYSKEMICYMEKLAKINLYIAKRFDKVSEIVCGIEIPLKGENI